MPPLWVVTGFIAARKSTLAAQLGRPMRRTLHVRNGCDADALRGVLRRCS